MTGYVHTSAVHSRSGARRGAEYMLGKDLPESLLDVGCGIGTWLQAAREMGVATVCGLDDRPLDEDVTSIGASFYRVDLAETFDLGQRFDVAICLEVAEHIPERSGPALVQTLCRHADRIYFSAACPNQFGQNHVNCQWPAYWQALFNAAGYVCRDDIRWAMWADGAIEPWYRQNVFEAVNAPSLAGAEPRICAVLHPEMLPYLSVDQTLSQGRKARLLRTFRKWASRLASARGRETR